MNQVYWNEPLPLQREYPERREDLLESMLQIFGGFMLVVVFVGILPGARDFPGSLGLFLVVLGVPVAFGALLFLIAPHVGKWHYASIWKRAFMANNADLKLNNVAIQKVIRLLKATTKYHNVDYEEVAKNLACSLRNDDPFGSGEHTTFSWEVLHAYCHFHDGSKKIQPSRCPRM